MILVQFATELSPSERASIEGPDIRFLDFIPNRAYLVRVTADGAERLYTIAPAEKDAGGYFDFGVAFGEYKALPKSTAERQLERISIAAAPDGENSLRKLLSEFLSRRPRTSRQEGHTGKP